MKRISFLILIFLGCVNISQAFEGVIKQAYINPSTGEKSTIIWKIKGDNLKMTITSNKEEMVVIPNLSTLSMLVFNDKPDENGDKWYFDAPIGQIQSKSINANIVENTEVKYKNEVAKQVKAVSNEGLYKVTYLPSVNIQFGNYAVLLKENAEASIASLSGMIGFPVSSTLTTSSGEIKVIETLSIEERKIDASEFRAPAGYKKFDPAALEIK